MVMCYSRAFIEEEIILNSDVKTPVITLDKLDVPLTLSAAEVNLVLKHLSKGSFEEVSPLINKIKEQGDPIINAAVATMRAGPAVPPPAKPRKK